MIEAPQGTQAVIRAIGLLKAFLPERPEMSLAQLSEAMNLKRATTHRLLSALESEGLVARGGGGSYHLGPAIIALGSQALLTSDLRVAVRPTLEDLAQRTGETTTLEVLTGNQMLILDGVLGKHLVSAGLDVGTHWPAHLTSTGKAILAHLKEAELARFMAAGLEGRTANSITDQQVLTDELNQVRKRGYAVSQEELENDYTGVSSAFFGVLGKVEGAICVGGPCSRFTGQRLAELGELVMAAAKGLSRRHDTGQ